MFSTLFHLIAAHFVVDFALQPDAMGEGKNPFREQRRGALFPHWGYWMLAHASTHGIAVSLITGEWLLGVLETLLHGAIDICKCRNLINQHVDQALHLACKVGYWWWLL